MQTRTPLSKAPVRRPPVRRDNRRYYIGSAVLLVILAVLSVGAFIFTSWHAAGTAHEHPEGVSSTPVSTVTQQPTAPPTPTPSPTPVPLVSNQQLNAQIDGFFTNLVGKQNFSGSVLVARDGQTIIDKGYSMADWSHNTPNSADTRFFLGSLTKEFTATAILILQERGKLHVQDSPCVYINPCPSPWKPVTIQEMLSHTSGIPEEDGIPVSNASTPAGWIYLFNNYPLAFTPGSQFSYCSVCFQILAYVVERASGQSYVQFLEQNIINPLHMTSTTFDSNVYYAQANHATGYASWQSPADTLGWDEIGMDSQWTFLFGSGVLTTTVGDLYLWDQGLNDHKILSQQSLNQAYTAVSSTSMFANSGYGDGWFIGKSPVSGHRLIWHYGSIDGFRTYIGRYVDDNVTIIFLSNLASIDPVSLGHSVEQFVFAPPNGNG